MAYFKQILVKILAVVQSFQVANELRARHPLANVLRKKKQKDKRKFTFISHKHWDAFAHFSLFIHLLI